MKRDYNRATHEIAHLDRRSEDSQVWIGTLPIVVHEVIQYDCIKLCLRFSSFDRSVVLPFFCLIEYKYKLCIKKKKKKKDSFNEIKL